MILRDNNSPAVSGAVGVGEGAKAGCGCGVGADGDTGGADWSRNRNNSPHCSHSIGSPSRDNGKTIRFPQELHRIWPFVSLIT